MTDDRSSSMMDYRLTAWLPQGSISLGVSPLCHVVGPVLLGQLVHLVLKGAEGRAIPSKDYIPILAPLDSEPVVAATCPSPSPSWTRTCIGSEVPAGIIE